MTDSPTMVEHLILQRSRMKLLDEILEIDDEHIVTSTRIDNDWPGTEHGRAVFTALIELAAQSVAALVGANDRKAGRAPSIGYLVGIKQAVFHTQSIPVRTPLLTRVSLVTFIGVYGIFRGRIEADGVLLAELELQVSRPGT